MRSQPHVGINYSLNVVRSGTAPRPKIRAAVSHKNRRNDDKTGDTMSRASIVHLLSTKLLDWDPIASIEKRELDGTCDEYGAQEELAKIPDVFTSCDDYISAWEPKIVEEIQTSIISEFPPRNVEQVRMGSMHCTINNSHRRDHTLVESAPSDSTSTSSSYRHVKDSPLVTLETFFTR